MVKSIGNRNPVLAAIQTAYLGNPVLAAMRADRCLDERHLFAIHSLGIDAEHPQGTGGREEAAALQMTLIGLMTAAVQETHLNAVYPSKRTRNPSTARAESGGKMPPHWHCDVAEDQLNPVTETVGCK